MICSKNFFDFLIPQDEPFIMNQCRIILGLDFALCLHN